MRNLFFAIVCLLPLRGVCLWTNLNTGINDDLTGVVFWGDTGIVSGHKGLYYTTTNALNWTRFTIANNPADSLLYEHTRFNYCTALNQQGTTVFACGRDTVMNKAVVMYLTFPSMSYGLFSITQSAGGLNRMGVTYNQQLYAAGDSGLLVKCSTTGYTVIPTALTDDLNAIDFWSTSFIIVADSTALKGTFADTVFAFTNTQTSSYTHRDVLFRDINTAYSAGSTFTMLTASAVSAIDEYDFGPLNGRCMLDFDFGFLVGTDHGIFRYNNGDSYLEYYPPSANCIVNAFWVERTSYRYYACGNNGLLLHTTDIYNVQPYTKLALPGYCVNATPLISGVTGSAYICRWYIDGQLEHTGCSVFTHRFDSAGAHRIEVVAANAVYADTAVQIIHIIDVPQINLPVTVTDSVLCRAGQTDIIINNSQTDVFYSLFRFNGQSVQYGTSAPGNGGMLSFTSALLNTEDYYYLKATSTLAACSRSFTDSIFIDIENPRVDFHPATINAELGEPVDFYQTCFDAQQFAWTFPAGASSATSNVPDPQVSFSVQGPTQVKLVTSTYDGCKDSAQLAGPFVYNPPPLVDSCWILANDSNYGLSARSLDPQILSVTPSRDGFFIYGVFNGGIFTGAIFDSQQGARYKLPHTSGGYLAKYDTRGALKWMVHSRLFYDDYDFINSVVEDSSGNIYLCGYTDDYFYDNAGDSVFILGHNYHSNYIAKLDSRGRLLWHLEGTYFVPSRLFLDKDQNLLASGAISQMDIPMRLNGVYTDTIYRMVGSEWWTHALVKITPTGRVIWDAGMNLDNVNGADILTIGHDDNNNLYVNGYFEQDAMFYSAGSTQYDWLVGPQNYGSTFFLVKYNSAGMLQWMMQGPQGYRRTVIMSSMVTDKAGNCYVAGNKDFFQPASTFQNTDSTLTQVNTGISYLAKINTSGICEWITGSTSPGYSVPMLSLFPTQHRVHTQLHLVKYILKLFLSKKTYPEK